MIADVLARMRDQRDDLLADLADTRRGLEQLRWAVPVSIEAAERAAETRARVENTAAELERMAALSFVVEPEEWRRIVCADGCLFHDDPGECEEPIQAAHAISQQHLRKHGREVYLWDVRNGLGACYRAHRRSDLALQRFPAARLPERVWEFAEEIGLSWRLERTYGVRPLTLAELGDAEGRAELRETFDSEAAA